MGWRAKFQRYTAESMKYKQLKPSAEDRHGFPRKIVAAAGSFAVSGVGACLFAAGARAGAAAAAAAPAGRGSGNKTWLDRASDAGKLRKRCTSFRAVGKMALCRHQRVERSRKDYTRPEGPPTIFVQYNQHTRRC